MSQIRFVNLNMGKTSADIFYKTAARALKRKCVDVSGTDGFTVTLKVDAALGEGRYVIECDGKCATLTAAEDYTVYAAMGRFILESEFDGKGGFKPYTGKLDFAQKDPIRGMYFATHFFNFWHVAPIEKVYEQMEDLAMIGCNAILTWFDMHPYCGMEDPGSVVLIKRVREILAYCEKIGLSGSLIMLANEAFDDSPEELRADWEIQGKYFKLPRGHYHRELCPSRKGGLEEIIKERREVLEYFKDINLKYIVYWPYDQGGCTCDECSPWGANGYLKILPEFQKVVKEYFPNVEIIVSTWHFNSFIDGEWEEFYPHLTDGTVKDVKYIMSFFHSGKLPTPIAENGIPEGYKFIDFPEISMRTCRPWGGFGANPLCNFMDVTYSNAGKFYYGGYPYSEGIWEDLNKYICMYRYTGQGVKSSEAVSNYVRYYFNLDGEENAELSDAIMKTEVGLKRTIVKDTTPDEEPIPDVPKQKGETPIQYLISDTSEVQYCYDVFQKYNKLLPENITRDFRFRVLYLRTVIDREMMLHDCYPIRSKLCQDLLKELQEIYCCVDKSYECITPPMGW